MVIDVLVRDDSEDWVPEDFVGGRRCILVREDFAGASASSTKAADGSRRRRGYSMDPDRGDDVAAAESRLAFFAKRGAGRDAHASRQLNRPRHNIQHLLWPTIGPAGPAPRRFGKSGEIPSTTPA